MIPENELWSFIRRYLVNIFVDEGAYVKIKSKIIQFVKYLDGKLNLHKIEFKIVSRENM